MSWGDHEHEEINRKFGITQRFKAEKKAKEAKKKKSKADNLPISDVSSRLSDGMTDGERQMAGIHLAAGKRMHELEAALLDATNFLAHMHNSRIESEGEPCLSDIGLEWLNGWQRLITDDLKQKQIIRAVGNES